MLVLSCGTVAVAKPSNSGIPQMKPSGLQPPTRKRLTTPQTPLSSVESAPSQPSNKSAALPGKIHSDCFILFLIFSFVMCIFRFC